jgi:glycosyltransferase involved in cell wall biosynthesis
VAPDASFTPRRIATASFYLPSESKIGAGYQAHGLANALHDLGHDVTMFSPCARTDDARYDHRHVPVTGRGRVRKWAGQLASIDLSGFDVLHAHGEDYTCRRSSDRVHLRTMHGSCFAEALHIRGARERTRMVAIGCTEVAASLVADRTIAVSGNTRRWYPWIRAVVPNGVDLDRFAPTDVREPVPTVLFVGTYERRKRGRLLMEHFARHVLPALPDAKLWMVCDDAPPAPNVEVLGRLSDADLADRYRRAWVFSLPSTYEGFGVPYIEAMASGTPVLATANPGAVEVLEHGRVGRIVDAEQLGPELRRLLRNEPERRRLSELGIQRAQSYGWPTVAQRYSEHYETVLARKRAAEIR